MSQCRHRHMLCVCLCCAKVCPRLFLLNAATLFPQSDFPKEKKGQRIGKTLPVMLTSNRISAVMFSHGVIALPHRIDSTFLKYFLQSCLCLGSKELKIFAFEVVSAASTQSFNKILNNTEAVLLTSGLWQSALGRKKLDCDSENVFRSTL